MITTKELNRLDTLYQLDILDTLPNWQYDAFVALASFIFDVPIATISLLDRNRQWFKARVGIKATEIERAGSICNHTILSPIPTVIRDCQVDPRFAHSQFVKGEPFVRFYAGTPLNVLGQNIGTLCLIDHHPRQMSAAQESALQVLGSLIAGCLHNEHVIRVQSQTIKDLRSQSLAAHSA